MLPHTHQRLSLAAGAQGANSIQGTLAEKRGQDFMGWRMLLAKADRLGLRALAQREQATAVLAMSGGVHRPPGRCLS